MSDIENSPEPVTEPASLRFLRVLVTVLTGVMILGLITLVALFVIRFRGTDTPAWPPELALPAGTVPKAVTAGDGWYAVVTEDNQVLIFDRNGQQTQSLSITTD